MRGGVFEQALVVRGEDEGETEAAVEVVHQVDKLRGVVGVEIGGGFVGQHQGGAMDDGAGHGNALALAAGEQVGALIVRARERPTFSSASATRGGVR